jgi:hypothetical protein
MGFFRDYIMQVVLIVTITVTTTVFALINKYWNLPTAVVYAVLLDAGTWSLTDRLGLGISTKAKVRNWLDESGFQVQTIQDSNQFHFVITDPVGIRTNVLQVKRGSPISIIVPKLLPTKEQMGVYSTMSLREKGEFWRQTRLELMRYGIQFSKLSMEDGVTLSESVIVGKGLTGTEFLKQVLFVRSGGRIYWEILRELNDGITQPTSGTLHAPPPAS